ncbi:hypothetical protein CC78DRAFT_622136 [Lojkania enalia]|uniref:Polyketide synthase n=1 Tax=Lojkania enalia TaxID=147567 RepID=A0A9P4JWZ3_9PLEO|nr:hypothetical protein CC78DRAFT_622136 [Didymosphaeria enalia]
MSLSASEPHSHPRTCDQTFRMAETLPQSIAIIGSACRLPGNASSPSRLWELLRNPRDIRKEAPHDRFSWEGIYRLDGLHGSTSTKDGYWLSENIRQFDPQFFNINAAQAKSIDPQHRLLLENVFEAMESAGLTLEASQGSNTGVYVGMMNGEYADNGTQDIEACTDQLMTIGTARSLASNRISYTFDFRGPSMTIDTACSSSLMAVHLAVSALRQGECKIAFACGANLNLTPHNFVSLARMNMISPDGQSKMFDESANGYGRSEGVAVVCLKLLEEAIKDGDHIECIIRQTGTSQDGRTKGITQPSAKAQTDLISKTYWSIGLDPTLASSRPQFFEAHGTGTPAGDPLEAQAIEAAFFPSHREYAEDEFIYVGSIKSIIGHTEGTAGIAGLLKASLAIQHAMIPPNMLFDRMNPNVAPFTRHLRLVTGPTLWPNVPFGCPRRASVNSFGFGGSNVVVIIESYDYNCHSLLHLPPPGSNIADELPLFTPFTFSGVSEGALLATLNGYHKYLHELKTPIFARDLAFTLQCKRSHFAFKYTISATGLSDLHKQLRQVMETVSGSEDMHIGIRSSPNSHPRIMGVFTGQGAQWAAMGKVLLDRSAYARQIIEKLDSHLSLLPEGDRPKWRLAEELRIQSNTSRLDEATYSQPATAAIQILLVNLLKVAGVHLHTVVGHSSGEIGAAYAAELLSAEDAIRIAYYRGLHAELAAGNDGQPGAMLATSLNGGQAEELCSLPEFEGRIVPAAYTSSSLVTLSGDADAIYQAREKLINKKVFARILRITKAYHSHHMEPCAETYFQSLEQCGMVPRKPPKDAPTWFSSVYSGRCMNNARDLSASYWVENLLCPVQFSKAITASVSDGFPDIILEFGPHPVLERPVKQTIGLSTETSIPFIGLLKKGHDSVVSLSDALGTIWTHFGNSAVKFENYDKALGGQSSKLVKGLPTYPWQNDKEYWWESRFLRSRFNNALPPTELIGETPVLSASHESKWRRFLNPKEVPWLLEHKINGKALLPAAAYIVMVATAALRLFWSRGIEMTEVKDIIFISPIVFHDDNTAIETIITFENITADFHKAKTDFFIDFGDREMNNDLRTAARGKLDIRFGPDLDRAWPKQLSQHSNLKTVDADYFYRTVSCNGYAYYGPFRAITSAKRRMDFVTGTIRVIPYEMIMHPAILDALLHASLLAREFPSDSGSPRVYVPSHVRSIKIFPVRCSEITTNCELLSFDVSRTGNQEYSGVLYAGKGKETLVQVDQFCTAPFQKHTHEDDVKMFTEISWRPYVPTIESLSSMFKPTSKHFQQVSAAERVVLFHLRMLNKSVSHTEERRAGFPMRCLLRFARVALWETALGLNAWAQTEWLQDTEKEIEEIVQQHSDVIDFQVVEALGKAYPRILCHEMTAIDTLMEDNMLNRLYAEGLGFREANGWLSHFVQIITNRSPRLRILEVGAGTGSVTARILDTCPFASYTFTDVSTSFLGPAKVQFSRHIDNMSFRTLDLDQDPMQQGFLPGSFEIIVAANVLHISADVKASLQRLRPLLRPGGYLLCLELSERLPLRMVFAMGGLSGWWIGHETGRAWSPALSEHQWNQLLKEVGFSGIDCITPIMDDIMYPNRVFCTQAIDDRMMSLREPLKFRSVKSQECLIIGGDQSKHANLISDITSLLSPAFRNVLYLSKFEDIVDCKNIPSTVLSLLELDQPVFKDMNSSKWTALQKLLSEATDIFWVTTGTQTPKNQDAAYGNMMIGLGRTVRHEFNHLRIIFFDVEKPDSAHAHTISTFMLRWHMIGQWAKQGWTDDTLFPPDHEFAWSNNTLYIPRLVTSKPRNERYNSKYRHIPKAVDPHISPVEVHFEETMDQSKSNIKGKYDIREVPRILNGFTTQDRLLVKMAYSTVFAIKIQGMGFLFAGLGTLSNGKSSIVLSSSITSLPEIPRHSVHPCNPTVRPGKYYLHAFAANLVAERVLSSRLPGSILVISHDPLTMTLIQLKVVKRGGSVVFITSDPNFETHRVIFLHEHYLEAKVRQCLPSGFSAFFNISNRSDDEALFERVSSILAKDCPKIKGTEAFFRPRSMVYRCAKSHGRQYLTQLDKLPATLYENTNVHVVNAHEITQSSSQNSSAIMDWTATDRIPVNVEPADFHVRFHSTKTYLLIGSSDIAQSICEWMVSRGAIYLILASRNPSELDVWAEEMISKGAKLEICSVDVTNATSVSGLISNAKAGVNHSKMAMPPFGGVIHTGMVLKDSTFTQLRYDDFRSIADVKAKGSIILHEQLLNEPLDFFIMTGSISNILGNRGQANYNCGNAFIVGLANYRRSIGLPASVVQLGWVVGLGYITRVLGTKKDARVSKMLYPISEHDIHQIYAEAVLASPANSGVNPEITVGIRPLEPGVLENTPWANDAMFAHYHIETPSQTDASKPTLSDHEKLKRQLIAVSTGSPETEITGVIQDAFVAKLSNLVQTDVGDIEDTTNLLDLGVDSLVASEIGSWARKELNVQIPLSMILGCANVKEIVDFAMEHLDKPTLLKRASDETKGFLA